MNVNWASATAATTWRALGAIILAACWLGGCDRYPVPELEIVESRLVTPAGQAPLTVRRAHGSLPPWDMQVWGTTSDTSVTLKVAGDKPRLSVVLQPGHREIEFGPSQPEYREGDGDWQPLAGSSRTGKVHDRPSVSYFDYQLPAPLAEIEFGERQYFDREMLQRFEAIRGNDYSLRFAWVEGTRFSHLEITFRLDVGSDWHFSVPGTP